MTMVADLLARFRADTTDMEAGLQRTAASLSAFGDQMQQSDAHLVRLRDAAQITGTAIGGAFAGGLLTALDITKNYTAQVEALNVQFTGLMGSSSAGMAQTKIVEDFAAKMGLATTSVSTMSKELFTLTQGAHDSVGDWTKLTDVAASHGQSVENVAQSYARAYEMIQRMEMMGGAGGGGAQFALRPLQQQGIMTASTAAQVTQLASQGADMGKIWETMTAGADQFKGSGTAALNTMHGLTQQFHDLLDLNVGQAFMPLEQGVEHVVKAINTLLASSGVHDIVTSIAGDMTSLMSHFDGLAAKINGLSGSFTTAGLHDFLSILSSLKPELGVLTGLVAEFSTEFVGSLPIINRFAGPFKAFIDDGRGALIGLVLASQQGRDALGQLANSVGDLVKGLFEGAGAFHAILGAVQVAAIDLIKFTASVVDFVAKHQTLLDLAVAFIAIWEAIKIGDTVVSTIRTALNFFEQLGNNVKSYKESWGQIKTQGDEAAASTRAQAGATEQLAAAINMMVKAEQDAVVLQLALNDAQKSGQTTALNLTATDVSRARVELQGVGMGGLGVGAAATVAAEADTAAAETATHRNALSRAVGGLSEATGMSSLMMGGVLGAGLIGGLAADQVVQNTRPGTAPHLAGQVMEDAMAGATVGAFVPGANIITMPLGALIGATVPLVSHLFGLGDSAQHASAELAKLRAPVDTFNKSNPVPENNLAGLEDLRARRQAFLADMQAPSTRVPIQQQMVQDKANLAAAERALAPYGGDKGAKTLLEEGATRTAAGDVVDTSRLEELRANVKAAQNALKFDEGPYNALMGGPSGRPLDREIFRESYNRKAIAQSAQMPEVPASFNKIEEAAQTLGLNLATLPIHSHSAAEAIKQVVAALAQLGEGKDINAFRMGGMNSSQWQYFASDLIPGKEGQRQFTLTPEMQQALGTPLMGRQDVGSLTPFIGLPGGLTRTANGSLVGETEQAAQSAKQLFDIQMQQRDNAHQLSEAYFAAGDATFQLESAQHGLVKAFQASEQATFSLTKAQFELTRTQFDLQVQNATNADAIGKYAAALQNHQDTYATLDTTVMKLAAGHQALAPAVEAAASAATSAENNYNDLNLVYERTSNELTVLQDRQKQLQDVMNQPLAGSKAFDEALRANQNQIDGIKLQMDALKILGVFDKDPRMTYLQRQIDILQEKRDIIESHKDLTIGAQQDALKFAAAPPEIDFSKALEAAKAIGAMGTSMRDVTAQSDKEKVALDAAQGSYNLLKQRADLLVSALDGVATSDQSLIQQHQSLTDATNAVKQAFIGVQDSRFGIESAYHGIKDAAHGVEQAHYNIISASNAAKSTMLSNALTVAQHVSQLSTQGTTAMQKITTDAGNDMKKIYDNVIAALPADDPFRKQLEAFFNAVGQHSGGHQAPGRRSSFAEGGLAGAEVFFASGGENHAPQIYGTSQGTRVFNEPETGGEAYIPLGANKRSTAMPVLQQVMGMFGVGAHADAYASGGVNENTLGGSFMAAGGLRFFASGGFAEAVTNAEIQHSRTGIPTGVMLTQSSYETGHWTSNFYIRQNNPAGLAAFDGTGTAASFPTPLAGWTSYADHLLGRGEAGQGQFVADLRGGASPLTLLIDLQNSPWASSHYGYRGLVNTYPQFAAFDAGGGTPLSPQQLAQLSLQQSVTGGGGSGPVVPMVDLRAIHTALDESYIDLAYKIAPFYGEDIAHAAGHAGDAMAVAASGFMALETIRSIGALGAFAEGGVALSPIAGVFGESGPEALIPLDKYDLGGPSVVIGDGAVQVTITVHGNAPDNIHEEVREVVTDAIVELTRTLRGKG